MVTGNGRNNYTIVCHNYKKLTSRYVFSEENEIEIENINQYTDDEDSLNLKFCFHNIKNGKYQIKQYYVNRKNGSVQDLWRQLDIRGNWKTVKLIILRVCRCRE